MRMLGESEWLALWERGARRHPIDRALLLYAVARDDLDPSTLADLPLGAVNAALLALRREHSGETLRAHANCPACGESVELVLEVSRLLAAHRQDGVCTWEGFGLRLRPPTHRDLAAVAARRDGEAAAAELLRRCCETPADDAVLDEHRAEIESGLESIDPLASLEITFTCGACRHASSLPLDVGRLLWQEIEASTRAVLADVHALASAYGWTESEILALTPERRAAYLEQVGS